MLSDYVIVGAGSAGCVLANRLSADPGIRVLLLEAGPPDRMPAIHVPALDGRLLGSRVDWAFETEPQARLAGRAVDVPRGRTLGGSSSINALAYLRGDRADFDEWAGLGNAGWGFDDVLPYFRRSEHNIRGGSTAHGDAGPLRVSDVVRPHQLTDAFVAAGRRAGIRPTDDFNDGDLEGIGYVQQTQRDGLRSSTAVAYLAPVRDRENLEVLTGAWVTRIRFEGSRAVGVDFRHGGRREHVVASREVVLSGGAVGSPQLLLLSGVGPERHLREHGIDVVADLPGVGGNLSDHPTVGVGWIVSGGPPQAAESAVEALRYLLNRRGRLAVGPSEAAAFVRIDPSAPAPDLELLLIPPRLRPVIPTPRWAAARVRDAVVAVMRPAARQPVPPRALSVSVVAVRPQSRGSVTLQSSDPFAPPAIDPRYLSDPEGADRDVLVAGVELVRRIAASTPLVERLGPEIQPGPDAQSRDALEAFVTRRTTSLQHLVGTCKMGSDPDAVVDPELRVHGLEGLRVVDASIMPVGPRGHMNAPTIMIAEKAADLIRARDGGPGVVARSGRRPA